MYYFFYYICITKSNTMNIKPKTKIVSIRMETDWLEMLDNVVLQRNSNRNEILNNLVKDFVASHIINKNENSFTPISLFNNKDKLGYKKSFFNFEDAQIVFRGMSEIIKQDDKDYNFLSDALQDDDKERIIKTFLETGVKYFFTKIGIILFSVFDFHESRDNAGNPTIDKGNITFIYDLEKNLFEEFNDYEYFNFSLKNETDWEIKYVELIQKELCL